MTEPIRLDVPHKLGREGARAKLEGGIGKLASMFPGGGRVTHDWQGDTMLFTVAALGQAVKCRATVYDERVACEIELPAMLSLFAGRIRAALGDRLPKLLK